MLSKSGRTRSRRSGASQSPAIRYPGVHSGEQDALGEEFFSLEPQPGGSAADSFSSLIIRFYQTIARNSSIRPMAMKFVVSA